MSTRNGLLGMMVLLAVAGCDENPLAAGAEGTVEVGVHSQSVQQPARHAGEDGALHSASAANEAEGSVHVRARVYARSTTGEWVEMTRGWTEQTVEMSGSSTMRVLTRARMESGRYDRVRVEFERVRADVRGGTQISLGLLLGEVRVEMGSDGRATVEREAAFRVGGSGEARLTIELNSRQWVSRAEQSSRTVSKAEFSGAVRILAES